MSAETIRVLLVDDDPDSLPLTRVLLRKQRDIAYDLEWAGGYQQGLTALCSGRHDVCLLDYRLGARDGLDLLREAVAAGCGVPVIMLTGLGDDDLDILALQHGATDYLAKGEVTGPSLERSIRYAIERQRGEDERRRAQAELKALTSQVSAGLWSTDAHLRIVSAWGRGIFLGDGAATESPGSTVGDVVERPELLAAHRRALLGETISLEMEQQERIIQVHLSPRTGARAEIEGVIGVGIDVTDLRHVEAEFQFARRIQRGLLPTEAPQIEGYDIAGKCQPAHATGGDYFDFIELPGDSLGVVIADVSRHGFSSALIMVETRRLIRSLLTGHSDLGRALMAANRAIFDDTPVESFVTLLVARIEPAKRTLTYAGAGHEGYLLDSCGAVSRLTSTTFPLGIAQDVTITASESVQMSSGQMLLLTTDGLHESMSCGGEMFGLDRVWRTVHTHRQSCAKEILERLMDEAQSFAAGERIQDDMTAVLVKVD
ncbi:MAG: SpoIIE family protein phosphatase [Pirellulaceae bacterium]